MLTVQVYWYVHIYTNTHITAYIVLDQTKHSELEIQQALTDSALARFAELDKIKHL